MAGPSRPEARRRGRTKTLFFLGTGVLALLFHSIPLCGAAHAEVNSSQAEPTEDQARIDFERGLQLVQERQYGAAIAAFKAAYLAKPHHSTLFNIASSYVAMGELSRGLTYYERCLADGNYQLPDERAEWLRREVIALRERVSGTDSGAPTIESSTLLVSSCPVPGSELLLDGIPQFKHPFPRTISISPGVHRLSFTRLGYRASSVSVDLKPAEKISVSCDLRINENAPLSLLGRLKLVGAQDATVKLNDEPWHVGQPLPKGPHKLDITLVGQRPVTQTVWIVPQEETQVLVQASLPTSQGSKPANSPLTRDRQEPLPSLGSQTAALALGISGLSVAGVSVGIFAWNEGRHNEWQRKDASLMGQRAQATASGTRLSPQFVEEQAANNSLNESIERFQVVWLSGAAVSAALLGAAAYMYWNVDNDLEITASPQTGGGLVRLRVSL